MRVDAWRALLLSAVVVASCSTASHRAPGVPPDHPAEPVRVAVAPPPPKDIVGAAYRRRYPVKTALDKIVTNRGTGNESLYGTRNVRAVLNGVYYRGGANNAYHREGKRNNSNPLPDDGLSNLCQEGFGTALYMYPTRYDTAPPTETCTTHAGADGHLEYGQISVLHGRRSDIRKILESVLEHVRNPALGPMYVHCWNGWHASGYVAAVALRQFCGFTGDQGVKYWNSTAKGASKAEHDSTRERIKKFQPFPEYELTPEEKAAVCPDPKSYKFADEPAP